MVRASARNAANVYVLPFERTGARPAAICVFKIPEMNPKLIIIINFMWLILSPPFFHTITKFKSVSVLFSLCDLH